MRAFNPKRAVIFLLVSFSLTLILGACTPTKKDDPGPVAKVSSLSEKIAACESKLRIQMVEKSLPLLPAAGLEADVAAANASVQQTSITNYSADIGAQVKSIRVEHANATDKTYQGIRYELAVSDKYSASPLSLTVVVENIDPALVVQMNQKINISENCDLVLASTSKALNLKKSARDYEYSYFTVYSTGETDSKKEAYTAPNDLPVSNFIPFNEDINNLNGAILGYGPGVGIMSADVAFFPEKTASEFGLDLQFKVRKMTIFLNGKVLIAFEAGIDAAQGISYYETGESKLWTLPKSIWEQQSLGTSRSSSAYAKSEIPNDYQYSNNAILMQSPMLPSYAHFAAYWTIGSQSQDPQTQLYTLKITENGSPEYNDSVIPADLVSNETIQADLPQVQNIAKEILVKAPSSRRDQIALLLEYLKQNYTYDYDMLKNNTIRALTTEEALNRKTGVCQHYAVIFTAIARAMKIPSRIVVGYSLRGESVVGHAWVEAQVSPNTWRVIEPQSEKGLEQTYTRFYFPLARGWFLEDKNASATDYVMAMLTSKLVFKPAQ